MPKSKIIFRVALFALPVVVFLFSAIPASAFQRVERREVELFFDRDYDVSIGNGGIFIDDSKYRGTLVLRAEEFPDDRPDSWHKFTQRILDFQIYREDGKPFLWMYGLVRVYFNLDKIQYDKWKDQESNMSIWYFDHLAGGWRKCFTHWQPQAGNPYGRLWCAADRYTRYGVAWTQPTILMKMIKLGTVTVTPTP
ncbi:MAG: hypothetical protein KIT46_01245 [Anaerolineales bacterium]|nr:hypothetical protein [Anaerolineales bacterium]MCW5854648.1 hypothetical protein [Anaerolineales bacterium]